MSTLFKSNAVAHSDEELLQRSAILHASLGRVSGVVSAAVSDLYANAS